MTFSNCFLTCACAHAPRGLVWLFSWITGGSLWEWEWWWDTLMISDAYVRAYLNRDDDAGEGTYFDRGCCQFVELSFFEWKWWCVPSRRMIVLLWHRRVLYRYSYAIQLVDISSLRLAGVGYGYGYVRTYTEGTNGIYLDDLRCCWSWHWT